MNWRRNWSSGPWTFAGVSDCGEKLTGPIGWPDRTVFGPGMQGKMAFLEFKTSKGIVSKAQVFQMKWLSGCGHRVAVLRTKEQAQKFVESLLETDDD